MTKITSLKEILKKQNIDVFILPSNDKFGNEYTPPHERRLEWLTGFTGSNGVALVMADKQLFFTDGRYTLQAKNEVQGFEILNIKEISPYEWINKNMPRAKVGFDVLLHSEKQVRKLNHPVPLQHNPIDEIWTDKPPATHHPIFKHALKYAGKSSIEKRQEICENLIADELIITDSASVNWLLNIRGGDVPNTPLALCCAVLHKNTDVDLYIDTAKIPKGFKWDNDVFVFDISDMKNRMVKLAGEIQIDVNAPYGIAKQFRTATKTTCPIALLKACKNPVEIKGVKNAHKKDGVAVTKFLNWLGQQDETTEIAAVQKLEEFRREGEAFLYPSFDTISAFGANAAIVHYTVNEKSNTPVKADGLYLVDSGGQYLNGTTDVTRTVAIGTPTQQQKEDFTRVLKGHIALARTVFPEGTTGSQLDAIARQHLWANGKDYEHGTGHGVGYCLSVHEFPPNITRKAKAGVDVALRNGMILSNEPAYYKEGEYGIRIENMMLVVPSKYEGFLAFETLTRIPIDVSLVEYSMLTADEKQWLDEYNNAL